MTATWLIDASSAHHSGVFSDYLGLLPVLDAMPGANRVRVLATAALARELEGRLTTIDIDVLPARQGMARAASLTSGVRARIGEEQPEAVAFAQYAPLNPGVPYVLRMTDAHLVDPEQRRRLMRFYSPLQRVGWHAKLAWFRRSVRGAAVVLCATEALRDQIIAAHPELEPPRLQVAPFGLSPLADSDARHPGPSGHRLLTMHLSPRKNVEAILDAMARPGMERYELSVLGDLERPTGRYAQFLAERARALGVEGRIRSLGYIHDRARLRGLLLEHDVLLCPSRIESWSHTVVEGMALGMPVVASDIACHREVSRGAAWLVPVDDPAALAEAIEEAAAGGPATTDRIDRGLATARGYDWEGYARGMLTALRSATEAPG